MVARVACLAASGAAMSLSANNPAPTPTIAAPATGATNNHFAAMIAAPREVPSSCKAGRGNVSVTIVTGILYSDDWDTC